MRANLNKKCDNPHCFNTIIRVSTKVEKKFCKVCKWAYDLGYEKGYNRKRAWQKKRNIIVSDAE